MAYYLKIDGINGDVTAKGHENWIHTKTINFNVNRALSHQPGRIADREGTRPSVSELIISKVMDKSSPKIFSDACVGKAKNIQLDACQTGNTLMPYMSYTLSNAVICGYDLNATETEYPTETITISFTKIEMRYTPRDSQGNPDGPIPAAYDLETASAE